MLGNICVLVVVTEKGWWVMFVCAMSKHSNRELYWNGSRKRSES